jgi:AcrR family transcriptional regulator
MVRRTGRRPGKQDTRAQILAAAREIFAERGYDGATIRQIATGAGVDPALVHHYFGTKEELFLATVRPPVNPADLIAKAIDGAPEQLAERLLDTFLSVWDHPVTGPAFEALVRSAVTNRLSARLIREFFATQIVRRVLKDLDTHVDPATIPARATLAATQLFGLAMIRYIVKFEPLASAPRAAVVAAVAPNLQRYLTGDVPVRPIMQAPEP